MTLSDVRPATAADISGIQTVVAATELFPPEMVEELMAPFLERGPEEAVWLVGKQTGEVVSFCYAVPERLTRGTWNMLALAVHPACQNSGCGRLLVEKLETLLSLDGHRCVVVDTSSGADFAVARAFYHRVGYSIVARIPDFWDDGDDKLVFYKRLADGPGGL
jgi:ribosomal protein S18 acetylase RimI-like enzyme